METQDKAFNSRRERAFAIRSPRLWNELPEEIRLSKTVVFYVSAKNILSSKGIFLNLLRMPGCYGPLDIYYYILLLCTYFHILSICFAVQNLVLCIEKCSINKVFVIKSVQPLLQSVTYHIQVSALETVSTELWNSD